MSPAKDVEKLYLETRVSPPWQVHGSLTPEPDRAGTLTLGVSAVGSECLADTELAFGRGFPGPRPSPHPLSHSSLQLPWGGQVGAQFVPDCHEQ